MSLEGETIPPLEQYTKSKRFYLGFRDKRDEF